MARSDSSDFIIQNAPILRKNELYFRFSILLGTLLYLLLIYDVVQYTITELPLLTTQSISFLTLVFHIVSFILSILAYVFTILRFENRPNKRTQFSIVFNAIGYLFRVILELTLINYRREHYY